MLVDVCQELKVHLRLFQERVPTHSWQAEVVRWVKAIVPLRCISECFEDVGQQQYIGLEVYVVVVTECLAA